MRSFFCRINLNQNLIDPNEFQNAVSQLSSYKNISKDVFIKDNYAFGHIEFNSEKTKIYRQNEIIILSDSRLNPSSNLSDETILKTYIKHELNCPNYLDGDFTFIIANLKKNSIFFVRDHFGKKPLYYYLKNEVLIISSEIKSILTQKDLQINIDERYIADTLSIIKSEYNRTVYKEIKKLPPAHYCILKNGKPEFKKYWTLEVQKEIDLPDEEILKKFKKLFTDSIFNCTDSNNKLGAELSGGIDSSSIVAVANQFSKISTFSHILDDEYLEKVHPFGDERNYIQEVTSFLDIQNKHFIYSNSQGVLNSLKSSLTEFGYLSQQSFSAFSEQLYKKAHEEGVDVLLSGFGGDEAITSKIGNYCEELAQNGQWQKLKQELKKKNNNNFQYYKSYTKYLLKIRFTKIYNFLKKENPITPWKEKKFETLAINKDFENAFNIKSRYLNLFTHECWKSTQEINIERITHSHVSQRLEYCNSFARKYGIEYRYPFLDKNLIEFYLSIPLRLKLNCSAKRCVIRESLKGLLPDTIRLRTDKSGSTIPSVFARMIQDKHLIAEIIKQAKSNRIITKFIDLNQFEIWFESLCKLSKEQNPYLNPGAFYNYLKLILFIEENPQYFNE